MKKRQKLMTEEQWELIEPLLPVPAAQERQPWTTLGIESCLF